MRQSEEKGGSNSKGMPVPLREFQSQNQDQYEDALRRMKSQQEKDRLALKQRELDSQREQQQRKEEMKRMQPRNAKNGSFTYDYDGKIIFSKSSKNGTDLANQENTVSFKIGATEKTDKSSNSSMQQPNIKTASSQPLRRTSNTIGNASVKATKTTQEATSTPSISGANTQDVIFANLRPSQGVVFKGPRGEVLKAGEEFSGDNMRVSGDQSSNSNSGGELKCVEGDNIKRMTKKEYDEYVKSQGNYSRTDLFKFQVTSTGIGTVNKGRSAPQFSSSTYIQPNKYGDILDDLKDAPQLQVNQAASFQIPISPRNIRTGSSNSSSLKMAGINLAGAKSQIEQPLPLQPPPGPVRTILFQQSRYLGGNPFQRNAQPLKKQPSAGIIQVVDQNRLRDMLLN